MVITEAGTDKNSTLTYSRQVKQTALLDTDKRMRRMIQVGRVMMMM